MKRYTATICLVVLAYAFVGLQSTIAQITWGKLRSGLDQIKVAYEFGPGENGEPVVQISKVVDDLNMEQELPYKNALTDQTVFNNSKVAKALVQVGIDPSEVTALISLPQEEIQPFMAWGNDFFESLTGLESRANQLEREYNQRRDREEEIRRQEQELQEEQRRLEEEADRNFRDNVPRFSTGE